MQKVKGPHQNSTFLVADFYVLQFKDLFALSCTRGFGEEREREKMRKIFISLNCETTEEFVVELKVQEIREIRVSALKAL